jgi:mevalonate kinase
VNKEITVRVPGKLILSGEYAVLYGQPALAMAVNRFADITLKTLQEVSLASSPRKRGSRKNHFKTMDSRFRENDNDVKFCLPDLNHVTSINLQQLRELKHRTQNKYAKFLRNECAIDEVLRRPFELSQYTFIHVLDELNAPLPHGLELTIHSDIPISSGMGSSAAIIVGITFTLANLLDKFTDYLKLTRNVENLQHGCSSGLDLYMSLNGGCARFENGIGVSRNIPEISLYLINTGSTTMTTGQCIGRVAKCFQNSNSLARDFGVITNDFDIALQNNNLLKVQECMKANHRLLVNIGVVPERVQGLIHQIENVGAAGKICGAGSCEGKNAGVVLVATETDITSIVKKYGYHMFKIEGVAFGTQII